MPSNRIAAYDRMYYSGKHRHHGLNVQGLIDHTGTLVWISEGLPGSVHDLAAARTHQVLSACQRADLVVLADKGYQGANCGALASYRGRALSDSAHAANKAYAQVRGQGERGFVTLASWHILDRLRCFPRRASRYPRAILTIELESWRWKTLTDQRPVCTREGARRPRRRRPQAAPELDVHGDVATDHPIEKPRSEHANLFAAESRGAAGSRGVDRGERGFRAVSLVRAFEEHGLSHGARGAEAGGCAHSASHWVGSTIVGSDRALEGER